MRIIYRFVICLFIFSIFSGCAQKRDTSDEATSDILEKISAKKNISKINGVSFVASGDSVNSQNIIPLKNIHANYAAVMPFAFIKSLEHPEVIYDRERQWYGETEQGVKQYISMLHANDIKVMLKPQIWIHRGAFTGLLKMASEEEWLQLEVSYRNFIIDFAKVAEIENVEIFCIGTELENFIAHRPEYWRKLIVEVRAIYKGKITYAANWDEYKRVPFWKLLDFIGVDAYFPISGEKTPTVAETILGWKQWKTELKTFSEIENKKIIFTEYGYRSVDFSGKEPWKSDREMTAVNMEAQINLLSGLYQTLWKEEWFAGGFLWKWFIAHEVVGGAENTQFTPQNKPAEAIIKKHFTTAN
ncbi:glycoside hydrolase [Aequorivita sp. Q41]|uniref:glycoside hydrolase family 113 n=1 Tax=Aequorivita sp. Q41 TaxID=3153300 RepID=UPI0032424699